MKNQKDFCFHIVDSRILANTRVAESKYFSKIMISLVADIRGASSCYYITTYNSGDLCNFEKKKFVCLHKFFLAVNCKNSAQTTVNKRNAKYILEEIKVNSDFPSKQVYLWRFPQVSQSKENVIIFCAR